jgi:hypothetical protein
MCVYTLTTLVRLCATMPLSSCIGQASAPKSRGLPRTSRGWPIPACTSRLGGQGRRPVAARPYGPVPCPRRAGPPRCPAPRLASPVHTHPPSPPHTASHTCARLSSYRARWRAPDPGADGSIEAAGDQALAIGQPDRSAHRLSMPSERGAQLAQLPAHTDIHHPVAAP